MRKQHILILGMLLTTAATMSQQTLYQQNSEVNNLMVQFEADRGSLNRFYFVENSPERRNRFVTLVTDYEKQVQQLNYESLPTGSRVDYLLFKRNLDEQLRLLEVEKKECDQLTTWFSFSNGIYEIEKFRRRGSQPDAQQWAASMKTITESINHLSGSLAKDTTITIHLIRRAQGIVKGLQDAMKSVNEFYAGYDPGYTWWLPDSYKHLDSAMTAYGKLWQEKGKAAPGGKDDGSHIIG